MQTAKAKENFSLQSVAVCAVMSSAQCQYLCVCIYAEKERERERRTIVNIIRRTQNIALLRTGFKFVIRFEEC